MHIKLVITVSTLKCTMMIHIFCKFFIFWIDFEQQKTCLECRDTTRNFFLTTSRSVVSYITYQGKGFVPIRKSVSGKIHKALCWCRSTNIWHTICVTLDVLIAPSPSVLYFGVIQFRVAVMHSIDNHRATSLLLVDKHIEIRNGHHPYF